MVYKLHRTKAEPIDTLENEWHHGPTGVGKSLHVRKAYGESLYYKPFNKWWDGYQEESTVLLDDITPEHAFMLSYLLQWADHYPFTAEVKGSTTIIRPRRIIVTSNYRPEEIFQRDDGKNAESVKAILRRFRVHEHK